MLRVVPGLRCYVEFYSIDFGLILFVSFLGMGRYVALAMSAFPGKGI